ncbi:MAG: twin-arginine translocase subunit TatC [Pseudomonadota bacterium]
MSAHANTLALTDHLAEIRRRVIWILLFLAIAFIGFYPFASTIYHYMALPLLKVMPKGSHMIATTIMSPFTAPLKLIFVLSLLICLPFMIFQVWGFIAPALYRRERILFGVVAFFSTVLFYLGMTVTYFVLCPMTFHFFIAKTPPGVEFMTDIHHYVNFLLTLSVAVGLVFEMPVIVLLIVSLGIVSRKQLAEKRRYMFVGCFIVAMFVAPPEVVCQTLVALPMYLLFEIGLLLARLLAEKPKNIINEVGDEV